MNFRPLTEFSLYRYRYAISFGLLSALVIGLFSLNFLSIPSGMTQAEKDSTLASGQITFNFHTETLGHDILNFLQTTEMLNLPYHLLQKASLHFFGLSPLGVRLPSAVLGALSLMLCFWLLKRWLRLNAAVVMTAIIATSSWFIGIGRLGTPDSMIVFWAILGLLLATLASQDSHSSTLWATLAVLTVGLSLYSPYTIYLLVAIIITAFVQPHVRYVVYNVGKTATTLSVLCLGLLVVPLGFNVWLRPEIIWQLLAVPSTLPDPWAFLIHFRAMLAAIASPLHANITTTATPLLVVPMAFLAGMGGIKLFREWHSARSHLLLIWLALLLPAVGLDPQYDVTILLLPLMLLAAVGMQVLIGYWYSIFPFNPYARIFGLLPIGLLVFSIMQINYERYFIGTLFATTTVGVYDQDPFLLTSTIAAKSMRDQHIVLVVPDGSQALYGLDQSVSKNLTVVTPASFTAVQAASKTIVADAALGQLAPDQVAQLSTGSRQPLVNDRTKDSLRFWLYSDL